MQNNTRGKIGIYVRVSTQEQAREGYSIPTQIKLLNAFCDSQGWEKREVYADMGLSAKDTNRPEFQRLKKDIGKGEIGVLLVYRLDRLTRSVRDLFDILQFLEENNCAFKSATENYDTTTAMGRMFIGLVGLMAQWERENLGERVAVNMREKILTKLEPSGQQPYGFKIDGRKRIVDEEEKEVLLLMVDLFKRHKSMLAVARELNRLNIPTRYGGDWSHQVVRQLLRNPALYGAVEYDGEIAGGMSDGIITEEEFEDLSRRIERQNVIRLQSPTKGVFSGILKCPQCNHVLVKTENRYRCNRCYERGQGLIRVNENDILKAFRDYIDNYTIEEAPPPKNAKLKRDFEKEYEKLERRRVKFQQMYADDFMSYEEFQRNMKENRDEMKVLKADQSETDEGIDYEELKRMMLVMSEGFDVMTREEMIDFMALFIREISFTRKCIQHDKNGRPRKYAYRITDVKYNRL